jgi:hypothetical protein
MTRRLKSRLLNFWKEPLCWLVGHDTRGEQMREWLDCHRCRKQWVGLDELFNRYRKQQP